jgi:N-acetyl-1-D-myo-inositol-2-amino-2-deoxy-alpha-D-glucopyranoside deacetylase
VTVTRGEEGEVVPGAIGAEEAAALEEVRVREIARATGALGVSEHHMLGTAPALDPDSDAPRLYRDSGMRWVTEHQAGPAEHVGPEAFTSLPLDTAVADLRALIAQVRPDVILSYDDEGTYGHPDHVRTHHLAREASDSTGVPFIEVASDASSVDPSFRWREQPGTHAQLREALESYRTQLTVVGDLDGEPGGVRVRHVGGQFQDVPLRTGLRLHRD